MKWLKFPKFPKLNLKKNVWKVFRTKAYMFSLWKKFVGQFPSDSKSLTKTFQHFVVLGNKQSGKSELIRGLIDQSQDLYPFETTLTHAEELQFYLGPRQVIHELSFSTMSDRAIRVRRQIIYFWKRLFVKQKPIILVTYNCESDPLLSSRDLNALVQYIAGKISLLAEIGKKTLKVRIVLTHLDKVPGYLELAKFLKENDLGLEFNITSQYETDFLAKALNDFYQSYQPLILKNTKSEDFLKIMAFFKEMPNLFPQIEEFIRSLSGRISFKESASIELLSFTSNQEGSTSFAPFRYKKMPSNAIFFRYPMLKHQIFAACLVLVCGGFTINFYRKEKRALASSAKGVEMLDLLQLKEFKQDIEKSSSKYTVPTALAFEGPHFFKGQIEGVQNELSRKMYKHFVEKEYRKAVLENNGELKYLYYLALAHANNTNRIGKFLHANSQHCADILNIDTQLLEKYVEFASDVELPLYRYNSKTNPFLPLTSLKPWKDFLDHFTNVLRAPLFLEHSFDSVTKKADQLLLAIQRVKQDPKAYAIAQILSEDCELAVGNENAATIQWIGDNLDHIESFLITIKNPVLKKPKVDSLNVMEFFCQLKAIAELTELENQSYNFKLGDTVYSFDSKAWIDMVVNHDIEEALREYMTYNRNSAGSIFFRNTEATEEAPIPQLKGIYPLFDRADEIPGRFSRIDYEKKVRSTSEQLVVLLESLDINPEERSRFEHFLTNEIIGYVKKYQQSFIDFYHSSYINVQSLEEGKRVLRDLLKETSNLKDFLGYVRHHTVAFSEKVLSLSGFNELNEFQFVDSMMSDANGDPLFLEYQNVIRDLLGALEGDQTGNFSEEFGIVEQRLSPVARVALHIIHKDQRSYLEKAIGCLNQIGVPKEYQDIFLQPIEAIYEIGVVELRTSIENLWTKELFPKVSTLFEKFPFDLQSKEVASYEEVEEYLSPKKSLYQQLYQCMSAYNYRQGEKWIPIDSSKAAFSEELYKDLNRITQVSQLLWNADGSPKPIPLKFRSEPFSGSPEDRLVPVLSYFILGDRDFKNHNESQKWHSVELNWWEEGTTSIGLELLNKYTHSRSYPVIQESHVPWSFFKLLTHGYASGSKNWTWELEIQGGDKRTVSLEFEVHPKYLLQVDQSL